MNEELKLNITIGRLEQKLADDTDIINDLCKEIAALKKSIEEMKQTILFYQEIVRTIKETVLPDKGEIK